jgi:HD-like signal output (HDOD) protein
MDIPRFFRKRTVENEIPQLLTADDLAHFRPMDKLTPQQRVLLLDKVKYKSFGSRSTLFELGSQDNKTCFLLKGKLEMVAGDGRARVVEAGTANARSAIGYVQPRQYNVRALSDVEVLEVEQADLEYLLKEAPNENQNEEWLDAEDRYTVLLSFYGDLKSNHFTLPSLPDVALKIREVSQAEYCSAEDVAKVIQTDPAMTAKLLKVYNSPLYRGAHQDASCKDVVVRLGMAVTQQLVMVFSMRELFVSKKSELRLAMQSLWEHSSQIAATSYVIAERINGLSKDTALMAGLTHDLGAIPVISYAENFPEIYADHLALQEAIGELKTEVGTTLMEGWHFPKELVEVVANAENWQYQSKGDKVHYVDVVIAAQLHCLQAEGEDDLPDFSTLPAFIKLAKVGFTLESSTEILQESQDKIEEIKQLLGG